MKKDARKLLLGPPSVRLYARGKHGHLQENAQTHLGMFRSDRSAPPLLSSSEGWDGLHSPVDVVQYPESRPAQTRVLLLPSWAVQAPSENTDQIKRTEPEPIKNLLNNKKIMSQL